MTILLSIIAFLVILTVLILVHELGHFLSARAFGLHVREFGLGLPPRIWGIHRGQTVYSLNWIPVGGFVGLEGEDDQGKVTAGSFGSINRFKRAVVLVSGVAMNFLLAVAIFSFIFMRGVDVPTNKVRVDQVVRGSPAEVAGLHSDDLIISIAGQTADSLSGFQSQIKSHLDELVEVTVARQGSPQTLQVKPRRNPPAGEGPLGVILKPDVEKKIYPIYQAPIEGTKFAFFLLGENLRLLSQAVVGAFSGGSPATEQIGGPVRIAYITYQVVKVDPSLLLQLAALLSLSLALVNILPLPALDGGRLAFVLISAAFRRNVQPKVERAIHTVGFIALLLLIFVIAYNDLSRLIATTSLGGKLNEIRQILP